MTNVIAFYHRDCPDGLGALVVLSEHYKEAIDSHTVQYNEPHEVEVEKCTGKDVMVLDFCFEPLITEAILRVCKSLTVYDHHKMHKLKFDQLMHLVGEYPNFSFVYDLHHSGAALAWMHLNGTDKDMPAIISRLEDRDLWKKKYEDSDYVYQGLTTYGDAKERYEAIRLAYIVGGDFYRDIVQRGKIVVSRDRELQRHIIDTTRTEIWFGIRVKHLGSDVIEDAIIKTLSVINCPHVMVSDTVDRMIRERNEEFGLSFFRKSNDMWKYSFRGQGVIDGVRPGHVAAFLGGGGHLQSAGFESKEPVTKLYLYASRRCAEGYYIEMLPNDEYRLGNTNEDNKNEVTVP